MDELKRLYGFNFDLFDIGEYRDTVAYIDDPNPKNILRLLEHIASHTNVDVFKLPMAEYDNLIGQFLKAQQEQITLILGGES